MKKLMTILTAALCCSMPTTAKTNAKTVEIRVIQTSDVHGCFFPYDFIARKPKEGSMARVCSYVNWLRSDYGDRLLLLDNGDILQGQPTCYYCNYVKPHMPNVAAEVVNYMRYDAQTIGNHDVETGHAVYDKWIGEVECPMLGANIVDTQTGKPYVEPYAIFVRDGVKIAVLGMLTPAIPYWLNEELWSGMRFEEMVGSCQKWMDRLRNVEHPDVVIGLFHSGLDGGIKTAQYQEDAAAKVAQMVEGFDLIVYGHDHAKYEGTVKSAQGKDVLMLNPSSNALYVADARISVTKQGGKLIDKKVEGKLVDIRQEQPDPAFVSRFQASTDSVSAYVNRTIGTFTNDIHSRDCYFGPSAFSDFIHDLQLKITGADISFNAPLTYDAHIPAGPVRVSDMFSLYRYENQIYVLRMTGREVRDFLELSYNRWVNTMQTPDDHIMRLSPYTSQGQQRMRFTNLAFNFDSAAGIDYEVDVTKPDGQKVRILGMSNGQPFDEDKWYNVVMNSYRGNGGGELLTLGAGIPHDSIPGRIVFQSERDQRYYLAREIEKAGTLSPKAHKNWRFVPTEWTEAAIRRDRELLFGND